MSRKIIGVTVGTPMNPQTMMDKANVNPDAVQYTEQELTEEQKMQARKNLGLYYAEDEKTLMHKFEFSDSNSQTSQDTIEWFLEEGKTYTVRTEDANGNALEEKVYECKVTQFNGWDVYYLNTYAMSGGSLYTNMSQWYNNGVLYTYVNTGNNTLPCTVTVYEDSEVVVPIEEQFIPESIARVNDVTMQINTLQDEIAALRAELTEANTQADSVLETQDTYIGGDE